MRKLLTILALGMLVVSAFGQEAGDGDAAAEEVAEEVGPAWLEFFKGLSDTESLVEKLAVIALIVGLAFALYWVVLQLIRRAVLRLEEESMTATARVRESGRRAVTILTLLANVAKWTIGVGALLWILSVLNVSIAPVLAGAGILGVAVAFGAQTLVKDTITGFFLLLEGQYVVGDYIEVAGKFGLVESIGLRVTVLKDLDNQLHYIPNGSITTLTVYEEPFVNYVVEVPMASADDAHRGADVVRGVVADMLEDFPRHLPTAGPVSVDTTTGGAASLRIPAAIFPTQDWLATEELPARVSLALKNADMSIPEGRTARTYPDLSRMPLPPPIVETNVESSPSISRWL
jgi:moderate conductance mechanosensitive channel